MRMTKIQGEWEPMGLERFSHLEDKIYRFAEAFKALRKENSALKEENQRLRGEAETFRTGETERREGMAQLQKEREELRERVEKALSLLAALEEQ
jgi:FtsZ-binding cell division protein ZapB